MSKCFLAVLAVFVTAAAAIAQPLADRVPADALVYVGWSGSRNLGSTYESSRMKSVLESSDLPKLFTEFLPKAAERAGRDSAEVGEVLNFISAIGGRAWKHPTAFYFGGFDFTDPRNLQPRVAILCDAGDEAVALKAEVQKAIDRAGKSEVPMKVVADGTLVVVTIGTGVHAPAAKGASNLSGDAQFKSVMAQLHEKSVAAGYVNGAGIVKMLDSMPTARRSQKRDLEQWIKIRDALGLVNAKGAGWSGAFEGKDWAVKAFVAAPAPRSGIYSIFDAKPVSDDLLKIIPDSATMAAACNADPAKLLNDVRAAAGKIDPKSTKDIDEGLDRFRTMTGLDLQKDVLEPLGDQWACFSGPTVAGTFSFTTVLVNKLDDPAKAETSLAQLARSATTLASGAIAAGGPPGMGGFKVSETTSGGVKIHYIALPIIKPAWSVNNGVLYVGAWPQVVAAAAKSAPAAGGKSILDNENFAALRKRLGGSQQLTSIKFADLEKTTPAVYPAWIFIFGYTGFLDMFGMPTPPMILPPLPDLVKNMGPAGKVTWTDDAGFHVNGVSPFPGSTVIGSDPTLSATGPLALSIMLPSLNRARETANRVKCMSNERQIGQAILLYSNENRGKYPPDLGTLILTQDVTPEVFTCPSSDNAVPPEIVHAPKEEQAKWVNANSSYVYVGAGLKNDAPADMIVLYERPDDHDEDGLNFLYGDGHVEWQSMPVAQELIKNAGKKP